MRDKEWSKERENGGRVRRSWLGRDSERGYEVSSNFKQKWTLWENNKEKMGAERRQYTF